MDSIELKRPVVVKAIMTPDFRMQLVADAHSQIGKIEENLDVIKNEESHVLIAEQSDPKGAARYKAELAEEKNNLERMKSNLLLKIKEAENFADGAEMPYQVIEGTVVVKVGDDLLEKMSATEIIIKDWKIVEIRNN